MEQLALAFLVYFSEPNFELSDRWKVNEVGNVCLLYDTTGDGKNDVKTCRRTRYNGFTKAKGSDTCEYVAEGVKCVVPHNDSSYEYVAFKYPYIYYVDVDGDEQIDMIIIDREELGRQFLPAPWLLPKGKQEKLCELECK